MPQTISLSVVLACRNEQAYIESCVRALLHGTVAAIEVIVVDGMSTDDTRIILARLADEDDRLHLIDNPAHITPVAFNLGIRAARGEFIAICGAHSVPKCDWAEKNLAALAAHPEAIAVGGRLETLSGSAVGEVIAAVMSSRFGVGNARFRTGGAPGFVDTVVFGSYRRRAFETYGYFDEQLATNQDDEFNTRLRAAGELLWFDPAISCRYFCRPSWSTMLRQYWRYGRFKPAVFLKCGRIGGWRQLMPAAWVLFLPFSLLSRAGRAALALYAAAGLSASLFKARRLGLRTLLFLPVAASLHIAYGLGFWFGLARDLAG